MGDQLVVMIRSWFFRPSWSQSTCHRTPTWPPAGAPGQQSHYSHAESNRPEDQLQDAETKKRNLDQQLDRQQCAC
jgi:hypothetical protein